MKQINFEQNFSDLMYDLKNKFSLPKLIIFKLIVLIFLETLMYPIVGVISLPLNLIYLTVTIPIDIYNANKIKRKIERAKKEVKIDLNNLVYKLQRENVYIDIYSLQNSIQSEEINYDDKKIYTRYYMLDKKNQIKVLEEVKKFTLFNSKASSLYLLDENDITNDDIKHMKKLRK